MGGTGYTLLYAARNGVRKSDGFDVAAKDKIRFNSLVKKIAGARNVKETDLDGYYLVQNMVSDLLKRGRTDKEILSVYFGDEAA